MIRRLVLRAMTALCAAALLASCGGNTSSLSPRGSGFSSGFNSGRRMSSTADNSTATPAAVPSRLAYVSNEHGHADVWVMDSDGSGRESITNDEAVDRLPHWAAGGTALIYVREQEGKTEIIRHSMADGERRLLAAVETGSVSHLSTAAAGTGVAYAVRTTEGTTLWLAPLTEGKPRTLMKIENGFELQSLSWLGDGRRLAFVAVPTRSAEAAEAPGDKGENPDRLKGIRLIDVETGKLRALTTAADDRFVICAPRGTGLAFLRRGALYVLRSTDSDKATPKRIAENVRPLAAAWAPNGGALAYWVAAEEPTLGVVTPDGGEPRTIPLPPEVAPEAGLVWSPEGTRLGFLKLQKLGDAERHLLYVVDAAGGRDRRLTEAPADHSEVIWAS